MRTPLETELARTSAADAGELRKLTNVPAGFWSLVWFLGSIAALGFGAVLLV